MTDGYGSGPQNLFTEVAWRIWSLVHSLPTPNLDSKWHSIIIDNNNQDSCHQENVKLYSSYLKIAEKETKYLASKVT